MSDREPGVNPRFPLLDSLRGIAALSVFFFHLPFVLGLSDPLRSYVLQLNAGVAVFFLLSGFLLYRPFARARFRGEPRPALVPYAERRALRLIPAYWVALVFVVLLVGRSGEAQNATAVFSPRGLVAYFGFLQVYGSSTLLGGISAAWTLCVEAAFYALLPLWALAMRRLAAGSRRRFVQTELAALAGLFAVGAIWTAVAAAHSAPSAAALVDVTRIKPWLYVLPGYLDHFALGMALAVLSVASTEAAREPGAVRLIDRAPWLPWLVALAAFALLGRVNHWFDGFGARFFTTHELQGLLALGLLLPAVFGDPRRGRLRRLLSSRPLLWIGLVSYSVYLWHAALLSKLSDLGALDSLGRLGYTALALAVTLAVAAVSFYLVERPSLRLGRRLSHRRRSQDADVRMRDLERAFSA